VVTVSIHGRRRYVRRGATHWGFTELLQFGRNKRNGDAEGTSLSQRDGQEHHNNCQNNNRPRQAQQTSPRATLQVLPPGEFDGTIPKPLAVFIF